MKQFTNAKLDELVQKKFSYDGDWEEEGYYRGEHLASEADIAMYLMEELHIVPTYNGFEGNWSIDNAYYKTPSQAIIACAERILA